MKVHARDCRDVVMEVSHMLFEKLIAEVSEICFTLVCSVLLRCRRRRLVRFMSGDEDYDDADAAADADGGVDSVPGSGCIGCCSGWSLEFGAAAVVIRGR